MQQAYNEEHGITPVGIVKKVNDIMEGNQRSSRIEQKEVAEQAAKYQAFSSAELEKKIKKLETQMYQHSRDLEFEQAANVRDEINKLNDFMVLGA